MKRATVLSVSQTRYHLKAKNKTLVCVIEHNDLALNFISQVIASDPSIVRADIGILPKTPAGQVDKYVFVIDDYGLVPPIHAYLKRMKRRYADAKYIVLGKEASLAYVSELITLRIDGFLTYAEVASSLLMAIHAVASGQLWINQEIQQHYIKNELHNLAMRDSRKTQALTSREREIMHLVRQRFNNRDIASLLEVRESTIKFHLSNIFLKLQVKSRRDIVGNGFHSTWEQLGA